MQLVVPLDFEHRMFTRSSTHILRHFETTGAIEAIWEILRKSGLRQQEVCVWKLTSRLITNIDKRNESFSLLELMYCAIIRVSYIHLTAITLS